MLASAICKASHQQCLRRLSFWPILQAFRQPRTTHEKAHMASGSDQFPDPQYTSHHYKPSNKLKGKVALVTGGDSGIGKAVCHCFAQEGATVAFTYLKGSPDDTVELLKKAKSGDAGEPVAIEADLGYDENCKKVVDEVVKAFGRVDILVNNVAQQFTSDHVEEVDQPRLERLFQTNIFSYIFVTRHALKHMNSGGSINTTSVNAYLGNKLLVDYTATKGAILAFTRALALQVVDRGIRVNGVSPGPIWTPLIPATMDPDMVRHFGEEVPMRRPSQPFEVAPSYVFLASNADSSYVTGQVLHPNDMNDGVYEDETTNNDGMTDDEQPMR